MLGGVMKRVLAVNPGATSTKFAVFDSEEVLLKRNVEHQGTELQGFTRVFDQYKYRLDLILEALAEAGIELSTLGAVVGRGGLLKPIAGGTYAVNELMLSNLRTAERGEHASNLGAVIADRLAKPLGIPAFIVDPVAVDELDSVARISGSPDIVRGSMCHALNMKAVARKVAIEIGKSYIEAKLVVAHLGTGISLSVHRDGRMVDISDGKEEGPFAPDRCGGLPASQLLKLCFSGKYTYEELKKRLFGSGGFYAYLGTKDIRTVEKMVTEGDKKAELILKAMIYQIAKDIGALATVVNGDVDRIILTGGIAYSERVVKGITEKTKFIAPVVVVPGEEELESLAAGALRVLRGEEDAKIYQ
ncbi:MAG: Butyrate kinase [Firmicutes bacterium]|nr:Butyrate kinase [Bacillota bacterium]